MYSTTKSFNVLSSSHCLIQIVLLLSLKIVFLLIIYDTKSCSKCHLCEIGTKILICFMVPYVNNILGVMFMSYTNVLVEVLATYLLIRSHTIDFCVQNICDSLSCIVFYQTIDHLILLRYLQSQHGNVFYLAYKCTCRMYAYC